MSLEIDNLDYIKYLVEYAILKNDKKICRDLDLQVSCWLSDIDDIDFSKEIFAIIEESNADERLWKHTLNSENTEYNRQYATHTDFETMIEEMYDYLLTHPKSRIVCVDDPRTLSIGYVIFEKTKNGETARNFAIKLCDVKKSSKALMRIFKMGSPEEITKIINHLSKFYGRELTNKYGVI